jgi:murein DD-endopeptidase MepM/ murein hydrolase activator NlpD
MKWGMLCLALLLAACASNSPYTKTQAAASVGQSTTTVGAGENVYDVAKRLNIGIRDLIDANQLKPPYNLRTGQVLIVPVPQVYTVIKGDTLYVLARRFKVDQSQIAQLNHLAPPYKIFIGQQLVMPGGHHEVGDTAGATAPVPRAVETTPLPPQKPVKAGDVDTSSPTALAPQAPPPAPPSPTTPAPADSSDAAVPATAPKGFVWPVHGNIISAFGPKPGGLHNDGINIAAAEGTPVKSAAPGVIAYAGNELKGFGNLILIRHGDGWVTAYAHLSAMSVKKGDVVKAGQEIGKVGQTGSIDSPQLHFELRRGKEAVDPTSYLGSQS